MKYLLIPLFFIFSAAYGQQLQDVIEVDRVDFNSLRDDTIQMVIEMTCGENPFPDARNPRYVENVGLKVYLAWVRDAAAREYDYYTAEVEIAIMEQGEDYNVYFYLPGLIAERDRLPDDPEFFFVELSIDGNEQKPQKNAMSGNIPNLEILNSFISRAEGDGVKNEHLLMPYYLLQGTNVDAGSVSNLPTFLRKDTRD